MTNILTPITPLSAGFWHWLIAFCLAFSVNSAWTQEEVAKVTHLSGTFSAKRDDGSIRLLNVHSSVRQGDLLSTEAQTYARLRFIDGGEIVLRPSSQFRVDSYHFEIAEPEKDNVAFRLIKGGLRAVTGLLGKRSRDKIEYRTATATIGIRGTNHGMQLCAADCEDIPTISGNPPADGLYIDVATGEILVSNEAGEQLVGAGQFAFVPSPEDPPRLVSPEEGIQVTMPQSISNNNAEGRSVGGSERDTQCMF